MTFTRTMLCAAAAVTLSLSSPVLADERLEGDIDSATAEPREDCEALRETMERREDDNRLDPRDARELRERGC